LIIYILFLFTSLFLIIFFGATNDYHLILRKIDNLFLFFSIFPLSPSQLFAPFPISFLGATNAYHLILLILRKFHWSFTSYSHSYSHHYVWSFFRWLIIFWSDKCLPSHSSQNR
jgi:hypothetical protein